MSLENDVRKVLKLRGTKDASNNLWLRYLEEKFFKGVEVRDLNLLARSENYLELVKVWENILSVWGSNPYDVAINRARMKLKVLPPWYLSFTNKGYYQHDRMGIDFFDSQPVPFELNRGNSNYLHRETELISGGSTLVERLSDAGGKLQKVSLVYSLGSNLLRYRFETRDNNKAWSAFSAHPSRVLNAGSEHSNCITDFFGTNNLLSNMIDTQFGKE